MVVIRLVQVEPLETVLAPPEVMETVEVVEPLILI
jgi:hypothetical protein